MNNVFVLYDRATGSVWYPLTNDAFDAVAGPKKGRRLPFVAEPARMTLGAWVRDHPETLVLVP